MKTIDINTKIEQIIDVHGNAILRLAYMYLHNLEDAEDILQETLIKYIENSSCFENLEHEKAWLFRVAINLSKNKLKYNILRNTSELSDLDIIANNPDLSFLWEAVKKLPHKYSEVIHLYYQEEYSIKEIASILDKKESTIKSLLSRGRKLLKTELKEAYDFEV